MRRPRLVVGTAIEVHSLFEGSWSPGFEIAEVLPVGYHVRRTHDRAVLPDATSDDDVRPVPDRSPWA